jgi:pyridoxamine 5'-phosphate oxidase
LFWCELQVQVTLEGDAIRQSVETSDRYWRKRAGDAQLAV